MRQLVVATRNGGKIKEIAALLQDFELLSLDDIGFTHEIDEPFQTFEENALAKAATVSSFCNLNVVADDSGICVTALDEKPGVDSAFFSGERDDEKNLQKLLHELEGATDRSAFYKAVLCLIWDGREYFFEGICKGTIAPEKSGSGGFGYDPIFIPDGYTESFGSLPPEIKNKISHRAIAVQNMVAFLNALSA